MILENLEAKIFFLPVQLNNITTKAYRYKVLIKRRVFSWSMLFLCAVVIHDVLFVQWFKSSFSALFLIFRGNENISSNKKGSSIKENDVGSSRTGFTRSNFSDSIKPPVSFVRLLCSH